MKTDKTGKEAPPSARLRPLGGGVMELDLSHSDRVACEAALEACDALARESPPKRRYLVNLENSCVDPDLILRWKRVAGEHLAMVDRAAILGAEGLRLVALNGYLGYARLMGVPGVEKVRPFKDKEAAMDWLAGDEKPSKAAC